MKGVSGRENYSFFHEWVMEAALAEPGSAHSARGRVFEGEATETSEVGSMERLDHA